MTDSKTNLLAQQLKQLKVSKGIASKAVGKAKISGQQIQPFVAEVQRISLQIRNLEQEIKDTLPRQSVKNPDSSAETGMPSQFKEHQLKAGTSSSIEIVTNVTDQQWDTYVNQHPNASIYHTSAIRRVIEQTFGHNCHYLAAVDQNTQEFQGVLPLIEMKSRLFGHFMISMPFFNYGGLLASTEKAQHDLLMHASGLAQKLGAQHIEYRHAKNHLNLPSKSEKVAMLLSLPERQEILWTAIGTKVRAQIKKAQRNQLEIKSGREEMLADFYRVFSRNMRDLGTPVYSASFFQNMIRQCPDAQIINVYLNRKPVSTGFVLGWRDTLEIPWASTVKKANKYDANMFLYWEILKYAIGNGYKIFDFGRSSKNASTFRFKKQWGAKPYDLYWHYWLPVGEKMPEINPNNPKYRMMVNGWKILPVYLANQIGPFIVKSIP